MEAVVSPLILIEMVRRNLLGVADNSIEAGLMVPAEADHMRQLRAESAAMLDRIIATLATVEPAEVRIRLGVDIAGLLQHALAIGTIMPASSASAKAAQAAIGTRKAREAKAAGARATAIDQAIELAVGPNWDGTRPWAKASAIIGPVNSDLSKRGFRKITDRAVYDRLKARRS